jgi:hypothetical protein
MLMTGKDGLLLFMFIRAFTLFCRD